MSDVLDPRLTVARPDLAAASLRGRVAADRFAEGEPYTVIVEALDVKRLPRPDASLDTQALYGDTLTVYEDENGWGWAQAERDGYVGYVAMSGLCRAMPTAATHRVIVNRTFVYPASDMKQPVLSALPLDGRVRVDGTRDVFSQIEGRGFVITAHLAPIAQTVPDAVAIAERLIGVPYLWGGKSSLGLDCSGLVQLCFSLAGRAMPRDTPMQERVGDALGEMPSLTRGDLVFWRGHVGIMVDDGMLLHANAYHMLVTQEPLRQARERIVASTGADVTSFRRWQAA